MSNDKKGRGDLWQTPPEVIEYIEGRFGDIEIDLCASDENKVCDFNIDESDNFLDDCWLANSMIDLGQLAWCNPPYSNPLPFVKQCCLWAHHGYAVAGILNHDSSTKWFTELVNANALIMPITGGRIAFLDENGQPINGSNKPQFLFYLAPFGSVVQLETEYVSINEIYPNGKPKRLI